MIKEWKEGVLKWEKYKPLFFKDKLKKQVEYLEMKLMNH